MVNDNPIAWSEKTVAVKDLRPYEKNPRRISPQAYEKLLASLRQDGYHQRILCTPDHRVIGGHQRIKALRELGIESVAVLVPDRDIDEEQYHRILVRDNVDYGEWELHMLAEIMPAADLISLGIDEDDLPREKSAGLTDEDETPPMPEIPVSKEGDVWQLGNHRVMCGNSTDAGDIAILMHGAKADMVFTDPPYNIDYKGVSDDRKIKNDKMSEPDFRAFLNSTLMPCEIMYVCCSWQFAHLFKQAMIDISRAPKAMIVWDKVNPAQHLDLYFKQHEIIFYFGPFGGEKTVRGDVWKLKRQPNTLHPTMKPIELIEMALDSHPAARNGFDGFGGSGSTLIACEKNHRAAYLMELDPKYVDVIIRRWQDYTGRMAFHAATGKTFEETACQS